MGRRRGVSAATRRLVRQECTSPGRSGPPESNTLGVPFPIIIIIIIIIEGQCTIPVHLPVYSCTAVRYSNLGTGGTEIPLSSVPTAVGPS